MSHNTGPLQRRLRQEDSSRLPRGPPRLGGEPHRALEGGGPDGGGGEGGCQEDRLRPLPRRGTQVQDVECKVEVPRHGLLAGCSKINEIVVKGESGAILYVCLSRGLMKSPPRPHLSIPRRGRKEGGALGSVMALQRVACRKLRTDERPLVERGAALTTTGCFC